MAGKFEVKTTAAGKFMFNLKAGNGQVILTSPGFADKAAALAAVAATQKCAGNDANYERRTASNGAPYFVLMGDDKKECGRSEMYAAVASMEGGIGSVKSHAADAKVVEA